MTEKSGRAEPGRRGTETVEGHHRLTLVDRRLAEFHGVEDVRAFDEHEIMLTTELGMLLVRGRDLQVKRLVLENGIVEVEGEIDGLLYSAKVSRKHSGESTIRRLFG